MGDFEDLLEIVAGIDQRRNRKARLLKALKAGDLETALANATGRVKDLLNEKDRPEAERIARALAHLTDDGVDDTRAVPPDSPPPNTGGL